MTITPPDDYTGALGSGTVTLPIWVASVTNFLNALSAAASSITYDNATSGLAAIQVQAAIDEIDAVLDGLSGSYEALGAVSTHAGIENAHGMEHNDLNSVGADDHHAQSHTLTSHSTRAHSELTGVGAGDHHAAVTLAAGGEHTLSTQEITAVSATATQAGHSVIVGDTFYSATTPVVGGIESVPRLSTALSGQATLSSGRLSLTAMYLPKGFTVNNLSFMSTTAAMTAGLNWWFALYSSAYALLANSADQTVAGWAANTMKTLAMTTPYVVPTSGLYYPGLMVKPDTGSIPAPLGQGTITVALAALTPVLVGYSTTGLTTTPPNPCAAPTAQAISALYCIAS